MAKYVIQTDKGAPLLGAYSQGWRSKVGVDATRKHRSPARSVPPKEDRDRVDAHWADYGLE